MKKLLSIILFFISVQVYSQVDNLAKNTAIYNKLKQKYETELKEMPTSAIPHWNHANELSKVTFNASRKAPGFYLKALEIDSTNAGIYKDFGNYLFNENDLQSAYYCFEKGKHYSPNDKYFDEKIKELEEIALKKRLYWELHKLPNRDRFIEEVPEMSFQKMTDYESLFKQTKKGAFEYSKLAERFKSNPNNLTAKECFFLLIGQVQQDHYKPYNYEDEKRLQELIQMEKIDESIEFAEKLLEREPTNLLVLRELLYCCRVKEDKIKITEIEDRLKRLFSGFLYSGDGSCERPIVTLSVKEEYPIAIYLGYDPVKVVDSQSICNEQMTDKMLVDKEEIKEHLYFNYTPIFKWMNSKMKE